MCNGASRLLLTYIRISIHRRRLTHVSALTITISISSIMYSIHWWSTYIRAISDDAHLNLKIILRTNEKRYVYFFQILNWSNSLLKNFQEEKNSWQKKIPIPSKIILWLFLSNPIQPWKNRGLKYTLHTHAIQIAGRIVSNFPRSPCIFHPRRLNTYLVYTLH